MFAIVHLFDLTTSSKHTNKMLYFKRYMTIKMFHLNFWVFSRFNFGLELWLKRILMNIARFMSFETKETKQKTTTTAATNKNHI